MKTAPPDATDQKRAIRWLFRQARGAWRWIGLTVGIGFAGGLLVIAQAWLLSRMVAAVVMDGRPLAEMSRWMVLFAAVVSLRAIAAWGRELAGFQAGAGVRTAVRRRILHRLAALGPAFTAGTPAGGLASAALEQVAALQAFYARYLPQLALAVLIPGAILVVVVPISWAAGGLFLATAPLIPLFMVLVGMGAETISQRHFQALARMSGHFLDLLQGLTTLKLFGRSGPAVAGVREVAGDYRRRTMAVLRIAFLSSAVLEFFASMAIALVAVYLGMSYLGYLDFGTYGKGLTFVDGFFILLLAPEFYLPLRELGQHYHARADAAGAAGALRDILGAGEAAPPMRAPGQRPPLSGPIRFEGVDLSYGGARDGAVSQLTLEIPAGRTTVVVGESGAGKTSMFNLILGFCTPDSGRIMLGDTPLPAVDMAAWRRRVAWVGQHPTLFFGTIADNIRLGRPDATDDDIHAAADMAGAAAFIDRLPDGIHTAIGEQAAGLSRGQAQRVALARAFLRDAPVMLLDEPLASLDSQTGQRVADAIAAFAKGRTLVVLTHRLDALRLADRVVAMAQGRAVFQGAPVDYARRRPPAGQAVMS